ncbi:hypothetical protein TKK_0019238 [Trichogramma kaykai]
MEPLPQESIVQGYVDPDTLRISENIHLPQDNAGTFTRATCLKQPRLDDRVSSEASQPILGQQSNSHGFVSSLSSLTQPSITLSATMSQNQQSIIHNNSQLPSSNGYASPMSSGSYDPYSPSAKIEPQLSQKAETVPQLPPEVETEPLLKRANGGVPLALDVLWS